MSELFLTNPELSQPSHNLTKKQNGFFDYKEQVEAELIGLGIPYEKARIAAIDMKGKLMESQRAKRTPLQAAVVIIDEVRRIYKVTPA